MKIALVAIGYNRVVDFLRLIVSLQKADYQGDCVDLIMSIDNNGSTEIVDYASSVQWRFGKKKMKTYQERQGLRKHILQCGEFLSYYDALVVFEDDIVASPAFYNYTKQCVLKYKDSLDIAGISLYTHLQNVYEMYPFIPCASQYDVFFFQMAQSWGQVWMKKQWSEFIKWYDQRCNNFEITPYLPSQLSTWGNNSWLKYHIKYCVEKNKYFVYPYNSLTTCYASEGEHTANQDNTYQVPIFEDSEMLYRLPETKSIQAVYYDVFFERQKRLASVLKINEKDLTVDLYGTKADMDGSTRYLLTCRICNFKIVKGFARNMRPHEMNIIYDVNGTDFYLYDTSIKKMWNYWYPNAAAKRYMYYNKISGHTKELNEVIFLKNLRAVRRRLKL